MFLQKQERRWEYKGKLTKEDGAFGNRSPSLGLQQATPGRDSPICILAYRLQLNSVSTYDMWTACLFGRFVWFLYRWCGLTKIVHCVMSESFDLCSCRYASSGPSVNSFIDSHQRRHCCYLHRGIDIHLQTFQTWCSSRENRLDFGFLSGTFRVLQHIVFAKLSIYTPRWYLSEILELWIEIPFFLILSYLRASLSLCRHAAPACTP